MSTTFTIMPGAGDWEWAEESQVGEPTIVLYIKPTSIPSAANVPAPKVLPVISLTEWELRVYGSSGGALIAYIPRWRNLTFSKVLNDTGSGSVELDLSDELFLDIGDTDILNRENVWSIWWNNVEIFAFQNEEGGEVHVQEDGTRTVTMSGRGLGKRLEHGVVLPPGFPVWDAREWEWIAQPAMKAFRDLLTAAQARGAISGITATFSNATDTNSVAWTDLQDLTVEPGDTLLSVLPRMAELAGADWIVHPNGNLDVAQTYGTHLEEQIRFQVGHDQVSFGRQRSRREIRNALYVESGDGDIGDPAVDSLSVSTWGRRELYMKASDAPSYVEATEFGIKALPLTRSEAAQVNLSVLPDHENRYVFFDYDVGDWVGAESDDPRVTGDYRILAISCSVDDSGRTTVELGCQTLMQYQLKKLARAIESGGGAGSITAGGTNLSRTGSPAQIVEAATRQDPVPTPVNLSIQGGANQNDIYVDVGWVAAAGSTTAPDPVTEYEVEVNKTVGGVVQAVRTRLTTVRITGLEPSTAYFVRVRAITRLGRTSGYLGGQGTGGDFSSGVDTTVPVALPGASGGLVMGAGVKSITLTWSDSTDADVKNGQGEYDVQIDTSPTFNSGNLRGKRVGGSITAFTDVLSATLYYGRVRAVDSSGNVGPWTTPNVSATTGVAGSSDIGVDAVGGVHIQDLAVDTAHIANAAIATAKIADLAVTDGKINTLTAAKITSGDITTATLTVAGGLLRAGRTTTPFHYWTADGNAFRFVSGGTDAFTGGTEVMRFDVATGNISLAGNITSLATITGGTISGGLITGGTVRGSTIETGTSNPRITLDSTNGLRAFDSGGSVVTSISPTTGAFTSTSATITGAITASTLATTGTGTIGGTLTITGDLRMSGSGIIRTAASPNRRMEISSATGNQINFFTGHAQETAGWNGRILTWESIAVGGYYSSNLELSSGKFNNQGEAQLFLIGGALNGQNAHVVINNPTYIVNGSGLEVDGYTYISDQLEATTLYSGTETYTVNWFRVYGSNGYYWQNRGGGWYMLDDGGGAGNWIRAYNSKSITTPGWVDGGSVACNGTLRVRGYTDTCHEVRYQSGVISSPSNGNQSADGPFMGGYASTMLGSAPCRFNNVTFRTWDNGGDYRIDSYAPHYCLQGLHTSGTKNFLIDHPVLGPTHHLCYTAIEGPSVDLLYRGRITLVNGAATVNIDDEVGQEEGTFEALTFTEDRQFFLYNETGNASPKGRWIPGAGDLEITCNDKTATVGWMVLAVRRAGLISDQGITEDGRLLIEWEKTEIEASTTKQQDYADAVEEAVAELEAWKAALPGSERNIDQKIAEMRGAAARHVEGRKKFHASMATKREFWKGQKAKADTRKKAKGRA